MEQLLINLVAGALGGNAAGKASPRFDLGTIGNTIAGLVGPVTAKVCRTAICGKIKVYQQLACYRAADIYHAF